jgi:hypothetical protein
MNVVANSMARPCSCPKSGRTIRASIRLTFRPERNRLIKADTAAWMSQCERFVKNGTTCPTLTRNEVAKIVGLNGYWPTGARSQSKADSGPRGGGGNREGGLAEPGCAHL